MQYFFNIEYTWSWGYRTFFMSTQLSLKFILLINGPGREKICLQGFANNKGADQPVHPPSLISTFVIPFLESIICKLATDEISIF